MTSISSTSSGISVAPTASRVRTAPLAEESDLIKAISDFKAEAAKTPAERERERVLEKHQLDEEAFQKLSPEKRKPIEQEIIEAVKRVTGSADPAPGSLVSKLA